MCDNCGVDHDDTDVRAALGDDIVDEYESMFERIREFSPELRNLLIEEAVLKVKQMLSTAIEEQDPTKSKAMLMMADNSLNLVGLANAESHKDNEEWTATGDRRVSTLWNDWVHLALNMVKRAQAQTGVLPIAADELPDDVVERLTTGKQTPEDLELVRAKMAEAGVDVPEDAVIECHGLVTIGDEEEKKPGTGLYL